MLNLASGPGAWRPGSVWAGPGSIASANYLARVRLDLLIHLDESPGNTLKAHLKQVLQRKLIFISGLFSIMLGYLVRLSYLLADCLLADDAAGEDYGLWRCFIPPPLHVPGRRRDSRPPCDGSAKCQGCQCTALSP